MSHWRHPSEPLKHLNLTEKMPKFDDMASCNSGASDTQDPFFSLLVGGNVKGSLLIQVNSIVTFLLFWMFCLENHQLINQKIVKSNLLDEQV